ncbi:MAG: pyruvate, phosphate dikinase [Candidatus Contendobacter odensis]|uniref:Pyruvate, phosphate dikinase n=1 Tax=Candidatus Contendibacter odensensis TaxID=1400860 RepID=A0A2G6PH69_9GAMM|nr:MAG: pyruvate, phosphate dikinase [Candidatus Contendobacter odensis]
MTKKYIYKYTEGDGKSKMLLGGKGANLCEMTQIGLRVPPGFVVTTEACLDYIDAGNRLPEGSSADLRAHMQWLEQETGKKFGGADNPLLVSVRSGSAMSMPGMMDTILNLGLNETTLKGLIKLTGNERFGYDAYRRFIQLFGKIALGVDDEHFDQHFEAVKNRAGAKFDVALGAEDLKEITHLFLQVVQEQTGYPFPQDPYEQLELAVKAVFNSWMGKRAVDYRREFKITPDMANGTAVNIVTMVFGNMGNDCSTGVGFTRDPGTGENVMYGEYLINAQGEDVVAGIRTPKPVAEMQDEMPEMYRQLVDLRNRLESHYHEVQDYEYTIEKGVLYCLQTRNGKMNAQAMVRTSVEMAKEGLISKEQALLRIDPELLEQLLFPRLDPSHVAAPIATGMGASPGAAFGKIVFDADTAEKQGRAGNEKVILVREETKPEDIHGFFAAQGILTSRGGKTSHAAVVARGMGKPCVVGAEDILVNVHHRQAIIGDKVLHEGDVLTIDGGTGNVYLGEIPTVEPEFTTDLRTLLSWADDIATLKVMANADTPEAAHRAASYGAMGIGLCRTERMFNATDRLPTVLEMILAETTEDREAALEKLLPMQRSDFKEIFRAMATLPVTVRLLDPPIHEFLPSEQALIADIEHLRHLRHTAQGLESISQILQQVNPKAVEQLGILNDSHLVADVLAKKEEILQKARALHEINPMLGHRGVRLGLTYPEIYKMQIRAVLEAAAECVQEKIDAHPEIMVPQVCTLEELKRVRALVDEVLPEVEKKYAVKVKFEFGTMMEVVRACLRAGEIADVAEFFSFGTNDLTQATFSFSREDAENKFLPFYNSEGILNDNPFEALDTKGVGQLMEFAVENGRKTRSDLKVGICGEQGGHPRSMRFCHHANLTYVSCSAPRVPIARLAAAHAKLLEESFKP